MMLSGQADTDAYYGRLVRARDYSRRASESAVRAGSKETAALWQAIAGCREAEFGNTAAARQKRRGGAGVAVGTRRQAAGSARRWRAPGTHGQGEEPCRGTGENLFHGYDAETLLSANYSLCDRNRQEQSLAGDTKILEAALPYESGRNTGVSLLYPVWMRGCRRIWRHITARRCRGVSEDDRPSRDCRESAGRITGASRVGQSLRPVGRQRQSPRFLSEFPDAVERRRPRTWVSLLPGRNTRSFTWLDKRLSFTSPDCRLQIGV